MKFLKLNLFLLILLILNSCSSEDINNNSLNLEEINSIKIDSNFINITEVKNIANKIFLVNKEMFCKGNRKKQIYKIKTIGEALKKPSYYIVNYKDGGFIIISSDKRMHPILAFSDKNNFDLNSENYPSILVNWLAKQNKYVNDLRNGKIKEVFNYNNHWKTNSIENYLLTSTRKNTALKDLQVRNYTPISSHGPLISTRWGQGAGYNNFAPYKNCSKYDNKRTPTGCVATAMSQIMKFHNYPNNYNWSIMPNRIYNSTTSNGANEISRLMRDAGNSVDMDWDCESSGAQTRDAANALKSFFGFKSANYSNNYTYSINDIKAGYPVILRGGRAEDWLFFKIYRGGHAWVCDGYKLGKVEVRIPTGRWGYTWRWINVSSYHMNWGWNGSWNGWYNGMINSIGDYSYQSGVIYNIRK